MIRPLAIIRSAIAVLSDAGALQRAEEERAEAVAATEKANERAGWWQSQVRDAVRARVDCDRYKARAASAHEALSRSEQRELEIAAELDKEKARADAAEKWSAGLRDDLARALERVAQLEDAAGPRVEDWQKEADKITALNERLAECQRSKQAAQERIRELEDCDMPLLQAKARTADGLAQAVMRLEAELAKAWRPWPPEVNPRRRVAARHCRRNWYGERWSTDVIHHSGVEYRELQKEAGGG